MFPRSDRQNNEADPQPHEKRDWPQHVQNTVRQGYQQFQDDTEPRWPAIVALLGGVGLFAVLPRYLSFGPRWLPGTLVLALLVPTIFTHMRGHHAVNRVLGLIVAGVETFFMIASLLKLIHSMLTPHSQAHMESPERLLMSAAALWLTNILVFALWYWHLDAGGPNERDMSPGHCHGSFLFPQMTMTDERLAQSGQSGWSPGFVDYLFLAFNSSTALSPADTAVLSRWAKLLMMVQAAISLTVIAILAARAINTLGG
ncbi:MAG: hypothetical protein M3Y13_15180 [Armatimonadota bacterium]|nr:hypothetical protein [Armatimonadota bacterium]